MQLVIQDDKTHFCQKTDTVEDCGDPNYVLCSGQCLNKSTFKILLCDEECQSSDHPCHGNCTGLESLQQAHSSGYNGYRLRVQFLYGQSSLLPDEVAEHAFNPVGSDRENVIDWKFITINIVFSMLLADYSLIFTLLPPFTLVGLSFLRRLASNDWS